MLAAYGLGTLVFAVVLDRIGARAARNVVREEQRGFDVIFRQPPE
jgi:hypothetical protein